LSRTNQIFARELFERCVSSAFGLKIQIVAAHNAKKTTWLRNSKFYQMDSVFAAKQLTTPRA